MYNKEEQKALYELSKQYLGVNSRLGDNPVSERAKDLQKLIFYHEHRYYILNDPVVSDYEYDQLYKQLEAIEEAHPELISPDSPTQRVSADLTSGFPSVPHLTPMLSLNNSYNEEDLIDFDRQVRKLTGLGEEDRIEYAVEPKFDGGSIALVYEADRLKRAATRGNGKKGEEMTANARVIRSIPLKAAFSTREVFRAEIRGEVLIRKDAFKQINQEREKEGLNLFANARNTATGGLRMKNPTEAAKRGLEAFIYTLGFAERQDGEDLIDTFTTHQESIDFLAKLGFKVPEEGRERKVCQDIREVVAFCLQWEEQREAYPYEIDGMVVKVNSRELQERCGYTSHHPRWAIAFKFKAKQATTRLEKIEYQVGKVGSITPVAKLDPVQLAGVTVSSVSLHNEDFIKGKDLRIKDTVLVERAGDVIPYIVKALDELRDGSEEPIIFPEYCPVNDTDQPVKLERLEGESAWRCPKCVCGRQDLQRIIFHVSKPAMDIDGMGRQIIERFYDLGWLRTIADVYRLDFDKIAELEGFGEKSARNMQRAIEKAKSNPLHRVLHSLSLHHLGKRASELIAANIETIFDLQEKTEEELTEIKEIGPVLARNVIEYFQDEDNIQLLKEMEAAGVNLRATEEDRPREVASDGPLIGKTILFTGSLDRMTRKQAQELAADAGARNISAVSSKLNILVVGEKAGSKLKKAEKLGTVEVLSEDEFLKLIGKEDL